MRWGQNTKDFEKMISDVIFSPFVQGGGIITMDIKQLESGGRYHVRIHSCNSPRIVKFNF
jgi:hypothetical protein